MLSKLVYNSFLKLYALGIKVASFNNDKAKKWIEGRENIFAEIKEKLGNNTEKSIWMHCASLGEFEQGRSLLEKLKREEPDSKIILTFFSPSGYDIRKNYPVADHVFYLPIDSKKNAEKFIDLVNPELAIFVKYEFWYFYFKLLYKRKVPLIMLSSVFRKNQPFFKWYGKLHREMLSYVSHFFVQDNESVELLNSLNFNNATQITDTRIDRVYDLSLQVKPIPEIETFLQGSKAFIGGSLYGVENQLLKEVFKSGLINDKIIIAPHNIDEENIAEFMKVWGNLAVRFSKINEVNLADKKVLVLDTIGMLSSVYQYADMVFIGGGFGKGIHNILEPAAFGVPIFFGPNYKHFNEAIYMVENKAAFAVENADELCSTISALNNDKNKYEHAASAAENYIKSNYGGTEKVYIWLREKMLLA